MGAFCSTLTFSASGTFADGSTFSGIFQMDGSARSILASDITTTPDNPNYLGYHYISSGSGIPWMDAQPGEFAVEFQDVPYNNHVFFFWLPGDPSTFTGGSIIDNPSCQCTSSLEWDFDSYNFRLVSEGTVSLAPEPGTALGVVGAGVILALCRRKRRSAAAI
jgi:hypothetical protein